MLALLRIAAEQHVNGSRSSNVSMSSAAAAISSSVGDYPNISSSGGTGLYLSQTSQLINSAGSRAHGRRRGDCYLGNNAICVERHSVGPRDRDLMAAVCLNVLFSSFLCEGCKWTQSSHLSFFVSKIAFKTVS